MKKILFILLSAFVLGSCDFLDEESKTQIPLDNYFNDEEEAMLFLYGAYYQVRNTVFGTDFMYLTDTMTDNIDYSSTNVDRKGVAYLTLNVNNSLVKNVWGKFYAAVEQCNILIDQLERRPDLSPANSDNIIAEAKFIRAWAYFNLVQLWGDVPLMTVPVYSVKEDNIRPERSSVDAVYSTIISDMEWVATITEEKPSVISVSSGVGYPLTISRAAAKTLLAQMYLARKEYMNVIETLKLFADGTQVNEDYGLCSQYKYIFDTRYKEIEERKKEILWEISAKSEDKYNNTWHREVAPSELKGASGEKIEGATSGYQSYTPSYDLFNSYDTDDMRYRQTYQITSSSKPHFLKGYDVAALNQNLAGPNVILLRTADAYLMLAEAYNELGAPDKAVFFLNLVRSRATLTGLDATLSHDELADAILNERRWEFAGEGAYRLYDLRRTGRYLDVMQAFTQRIVEMSAEDLKQSFVNPFDGKKTPELSIPFIKLSKNAQPRHLLLPIPADERIANPKLTQNNGWN